MSGITTRKLYTKIKNFTEKDQVRVKYSHIGKDKKLMLSVYIGEDVYNELTNGQTFKRLKIEYIPNDMVIITPTDNEKEGVIHRYNGKGMFKTTCVRLSLSSYKTLKLRKKDFNNRVVGYNIWLDKAHIYGCNKLNVDLIGDKRKSKFIHDNAIKENIEKERYSSQLISPSCSFKKPIEISAPDYQDMPSREYIDGPVPMYVSHDFLNNVRDTIENRLLGMEERFEKRVQEIETLLKEFMDQPLRPLKTDKGNSLDISDTLRDLQHFKSLGLAVPPSSPKTKELNDELSVKINKLEMQIEELIVKMSARFSEIKDLLRNKSLMERIFGKD